MKDEELLTGLATAAKKDDERVRLDDERWERLAAGTISAEERRELEALAATDEEAREALEALAPLGATVEASVLARIAKERSAGAGAKVIRFPRSAITAVVAAVAIAAGVALYVTRSAAPGALPEYAMLIDGAQKDVRGDAPLAPASALRIGPDSHVAMSLRPSVDVAGEVRARALVVIGGHAAPWSVPLRVSASGAVLLEGTTRDLFGDATGERDVAVVVGRPGARALDADADDVASGKLDAERGARVFHARFVIAAR